jgi:tRNA threonylcarbamoyladenosine biosynthesis protein TsaB
LNVIAFDTASEYLDIALSIDHNVFVLYKEIGLKHSEYLIPNIKKLCDKADIKIQDIDLIICTRGPGSFTGLRVGMSAAKGLAYGLQIPLVSVPTLDVYTGLTQEKQRAGEKPIVTIPVIDARKKRFYCALYSDNVKISDYLDIAAEDLFDTYLLNYQEIHFTGPDAELLITNLRAVRPEFDSISLSFQPRESISEKLLKIGIKHFKENGSDPAEQGPLYIRSST